MQRILQIVAALVAISSSNAARAQIVVTGSVVFDLSNDHAPVKAPSRASRYGMRTQRIEGADRVVFEQLTTFVVCDEWNPGANPPATVKCTKVRYGGFNSRAAFEALVSQLVTNRTITAEQAAAILAWSILPPLAPASATPSGTAALPSSAAPAVAASPGASAPPPPPGSASSGPPGPTTSGEALPVTGAAQ